LLEICSDLATCVVADFIDVTLNLEGLPTGRDVIQAIVAWTREDRDSSGSG